MRKQFKKSDKLANMFNAFDEQNNGIKIISKGKTPKA